MIKRIFSTIGLWLVVIGLLAAFGVHAGIWLIAIMAALTQHELYAMLERIGLRPFRRLGVAIGLALLIGPFYMELLGFEWVVPGPTQGFLALGVIACCIRVLGEREGSDRVETLAATAFGVVYVPYMLSFLIKVLLFGDEPVHGIALVVWLVAAAKFCDVGAFLVGSAIGRRLLAPSISPKKTWEGAAGGVVVSTMVAIGLVTAFPDIFPSTFTPWIAAILTVPVAATAILSDLIESIIKRRAKVKDSSTIIPGIGGAFDLADSIILSAPVGCLLLYIVL